MAPEKAASYIESTRISVQGTTIRNISLLSYFMRGEYTLEPLAYGIHLIGVQLVELAEDPLAKLMGDEIDATVQV